VFGANDSERFRSASHDCYMRRRPVTRLKIKTIKATTSNTWISPPPTCKLKPSNQRINRMIKIVQSMISSFAVS